MPGESTAGQDTLQVSWWHVYWPEDGRGTGKDCRGATAALVARLKSVDVLKPSMSKGYRLVPLTVSR